MWDHSTCRCQAPEQRASNLLCTTRSQTKNACLWGLSGQLEPWIRDLQARSQVKVRAVHQRQVAFIGSASSTRHRFPTVSQVRHESVVLLVFAVAHRVALGSTLPSSNFLRNVLKNVRPSLSAITKQNQQIYTALSEWSARMFCFCIHS
jgi:hypothetical protein